MTGIVHEPASPASARHPLASKGEAFPKAHCNTDSNALSLSVPGSRASPRCHFGIDFTLNNVKQLYDCASAHPCNSHRKAAAAVRHPRIQRRREPAIIVDDGQDTDLPAVKELIRQEVYRPTVVGRRSRTTIVMQLGLYPTFWRPLAQLQPISL